MDSSSQFIVPTIIDVPELIVTNEDIDYEDTSPFGLGHGLGGAGCGSGAGQSVLSSKLQFLSSSLCYTIGLGSVWRFPYLCYKYAGGAFLAAYTLVLILVGLPLFLMELAFGQYANEGPITIWRISPAFEGIGYSMCLISALISIYYNLVNAWILHYLFGSITFGALPWTSCSNAWNSEDCFLNSDEPQIASAQGNCSQIPISPSTFNATASDQQRANELNDGSSEPLNRGESILQMPGNCTSANVSAFAFEKIIRSSNEVTLPANEYFHNRVLGGGFNLSAGGANQNLTPLSNKTTTLDTGGGSINWTLGFNSVLIATFVFIVLLKSLRPISSPKFALACLAMPYLSLFAIFTRALTLPGSSDGVKRYFSADWLRLQDIDIWADAIVQLFFSMSTCWGSIITLSNMNKFHNNFHSDALLLVSVNYFTSLASGLTVFATIGFMSQYSGIAWSEVADSGIGLVFLVLPEAIAQLPLANINSIIFFASFLLIGLSSQLAVIETVITTIVDTWPHKLRYRRPLVLVLLCGAMLLMSLCATFNSLNGFYLMLSFDSFAGTLSGMLVGILELIAIAWIYGIENFIQDIDDMISIHRPLYPSRAYWYFLWRYLTPSLLFAVLLFCLTSCPPLSYRDQQLPGWPTRLGWLMTGTCVVVIPLVAIVRFLQAPGNSLQERISYLCRPSEDWAPSSYISGPKLMSRHHQMLDDSELQTSRGVYGDVNLNDDEEDEDDDDAEDCEENEDALIGLGTSGSASTNGGGYCTKYSVAKKRNRRAQQQVGGTGDRFRPDDLDSKEDDDLKVVNGKANYIIAEEDEDEEAEEEDDDDDDEVGARDSALGLITNETNV